MDVPKMPPSQKRPREAKTSYIVLWGEMDRKAFDLPDAVKSKDVTAVARAKDVE